MAGIHWYHSVLGLKRHKLLFMLILQGAADAEKIEYRVWNPFRSKLAAAILGGIDKIHMPPGSKVLYLGAASGTTVSHVSDVVGPVSMTYNVQLYDCQKLILTSVQNDFHMTLK